MSYAERESADAGVQVRSSVAFLKLRWIEGWGAFDPDQPEAALEDSYDDWRAQLKPSSFTDRPSPAATEALNSLSPVVREVLATTRPWMVRIDKVSKLNLTWFDLLDETGERLNDLGVQVWRLMQDRKLRRVRSHFQSTFL